MNKLMSTAFFVLALSGAAAAQDHGDRHDHGHGEPPEHGQCGHAAQERERPPVGEELKDFSLTDSAGKPFRLGAFRRTEESEGTITVLTFWCTACGSCRMVERDLDRKARDYKDKGVQFVAIASNHTESAEGVNRFRRQSRLSFRVLMDPESKIARYLGARFTTTTAVLDAQGRLRYYGGFGEAEAAVRNLLAGVEVAVPESPGFGCAIMLKPQSGDDSAHDDARGHDVAGFLAHLRERLRLTDEQAAEVKGVLDRLQRETQRLENPSPEEFMALRRRAIEDIRVTLNDEQRTELEKLVKGMGHGHGSGDHGRGGGG